MRFLLDTCICVELLRKKSSQKLREKIFEVSLSEVGISSITEGELRFGAEKSADSKHHHQKIDILLGNLGYFEYGSEAALRYGKIRYFLEVAGIQIGPNDTLIAAHALALNLPIVTNNVREFSRVPGLVLESW